LTNTAHRGIIVLGGFVESEVDYGGSVEQIQVQERAADVVRGRVCLSVSDKKL